MPKATGPTSAAGKAKVSRNALKHGLRASKWLEPEERREFDGLLADLMSEHMPQTATEQLMVERIAAASAKLRRLMRIEDAAYAKAKLDAEHPIMRATLTTASVSLRVDSALPPLKLLDTLARYQTTLERQISKTIGELLVVKRQQQVPATLGQHATTDAMPSTAPK